MPLLGGAFGTARRAMVRDQHLAMPCRLPLWRLLLGEIGLMARRIGRWKVWSVVGLAFVCFLAVEVAFSSSTPGPALAEPWRWVVALALTAIGVSAWAAGYAVRNDKAADHSD